MSTNIATSHMHCGECGHEFTVELTDDGEYFADGYAPTDSDAGGVIFDAPHGNGECGSTLIVPTSELPRSARF